MNSVTEALATLDAVIIEALARLDRPHRKVVERVALGGELAPTAGGWAAWWLDGPEAVGALASTETGAKRVLKHIAQHAALEAVGWAVDPATGRWEARVPEVVAAAIRRARAAEMSA